MKRKLFFLAICLISLCSYAQEQLSEKDKMSATWQKFLTAISTNDKAMFKALSNNAIKCYNCLENTSEEQKAMMFMRENDSTWHERIYEDMIFVPISAFMAEDYDLVFTPTFVQKLKKNKMQIVKNEMDAEMRYEVLITTMEPTEDFEGMQHAFMFIKANDSYLFSGMSTIP